MTAAAVLVVDGANVVGSRPDGWWHDRPGAAARLWERLRRLPPEHERLVLVLEGAARRGVAAQDGSRDRRLRVVHAPGSGDDAIVAEVRALRAAGSEVTVVTADRGLRDRVRAEGAAVVGPSWLLGLI